MTLIDFLYVLIVAAALGGIIIAFRLLLFNSWFFQWLKGSIGLGFLAVVAILVLVLLDLLTYKQAIVEHPLATITIHEVGEQYYSLELKDDEGNEKEFRIYGDQWQLDVRLMTWKGPVASLGHSPLYRFDRLSGRYLDVGQEQSARRTLFELSRSKWVDTWLMLKGKAFWLDANFGSSVYMPMDNGAVYAVYATNKGILARAVNDVAREAVGGNW